MLEKIANILTLGGAVIGSSLIAANVGLNFVGYVFFLLSSLSAVYLLRKTKGAPLSLILQNLFFVAVNTFGLIRYFA